jgi:hypothetical protein
MVDVGAKDDALFDGVKAVALGQEVLERAALCLKRRSVCSVPRREPTALLTPSATPVGNFFMVAAYGHLRPEVRESVEPSGRRDREELAASSEKK